MTASRAGAALAVLGSALWLLALVGGAVSSPTVWWVVGLGVGVFLVSNALRLASGEAAVSPRAGALLGGGLGLAVVLAVVVGILQGAGGALLVLGGLGGIVLWVASSVVVAAGP